MSAAVMSSGVTRTKSWKVYQNKENKNWLKIHLSDNRVCTIKHPAWQELPPDQFRFANPLEFEIDFLNAGTTSAKWDTMPYTVSNIRFVTWLVYNIIVPHVDYYTNSYNTFKYDKNNNMLYLPKPAAVTNGHCKLATFSARGITCKPWCQNSAEIYAQLPDAITALTPEYERNKAAKALYETFMCTLAAVKESLRVGIITHVIEAFAAKGLTDYVMV